MLPMAKAVLVNRACAVPAARRAPAARRTSWSRRGTGRSRCRRAPPRARGRSRSRDGEQGGPDDEDRRAHDEQPLDAEPAREPPVGKHRRDLEHRVGRPPDADEAGVAAELDEPQAEERHDPGRGDPDHHRAREEQAHPRIAQKPERPDRADPGGARRPRSSAQDGRPHDAGQGERWDVHGEHGQRAGRLDEHADGERREDEPERAERARLAEPVPGPPEPLHGPGIDERRQAGGSAARIATTSAIQASAAGARGAPRRTRPTGPPRAAAGGRRPGGRRPGPRSARRRSRRPPARMRAGR